jgi:hypothetical protein
MEKINNLNVLSELECEKACSTVHSLKESWIHRHAFAPFYTLGSASYLDARVENHNYYSLAKVNNLILKKNLDWFYQKVIKALKLHLQAPINLTKTFALPGFHIYLGFKFFELPFSSIHCDLQQNLVDWKKPEQTDFSNPISFTMPIALPEKGGGLNLWDITYKDTLQADEQGLKELAKSKKKKFYPYQLGQMIVHSGLTVHQAAIGKDLRPGEDRITLQGHALFSQGRWQLYW